MIYTINVWNDGIQERKEEGSPEEKKDESNGSHQKEGRGEEKEEESVTAVACSPVDSSLVSVASSLGSLVLNLIDFSPFFAIFTFDF